MAAFADPVTGWRDREVAEHAPIDKEDVYGSMFFYLRHTLQMFHQRLRKVKLKFHITWEEETKLPTILKSFGLENDLFYRIKVRQTTYIKTSANNT
jgi:hypothetical protein